MKKLVGHVAMILIIFASVAAGQSGYPALDEVGYTYYGGGARAMAMGNAFIGLANDATAGTWNPAGLWILEKPTVAGSYNFYSPSSEYTQSLTPFATENGIGMENLGHFSFVAPVRIKGHPWVFSFNYNRNNERTMKTASLSNLSGELNPDTFQEDEAYLQTFNIAWSTRLYQQLSFGFTINVYDARRITDLVYQSVRDSIINPVYGTSLQKFSTTEILDSIKSNGFNFSFGLLQKFEKFSVGAVMHTPYQMKHNADLSSFTVTTLNGLPSIDDSDTSYVIDILAKQEVPLSLAFGVGIYPKENLTFTVDANFQNYGSTNWYTLVNSQFDASGTRTDIYDKIPIEWNNTFGIGFGTEYFLNTGYGRVPLRAGFRYDQQPKAKTIEVRTDPVLDDEGQPTGIFVTEYTLTDRMSTTSFSLGTGIYWSQIELNFAYRYTAGSEMAVDQYLAGSLLTQQTLEDKASEFRFTFVGRF